jgi:hypothetical protein
MGLIHPHISYILWIRPFSPSALLCFLNFSVRLFHHNSLPSVQVPCAANTLLLSRIGARSGAYLPPPIADLPGRAAQRVEKKKSHRPSQVFFPLRAYLQPSFSVRGTEKNLAVVLHAQLPRAPFSLAATLAGVLCLLQLQRPASARAQAPARLSALRASSASPCAPLHRLSLTAVSSSSPELSAAPAASPAMVVAAPAHGRARPSAVPLFLSTASSSLVLGPSSARFLLPWLAVL